MSAAHLHVVHDELVGERVPDMRLLHFLVHYRVHDAGAAVDAERECHLLVHSVKVRVCDLVDQQPHAYDARLLVDREAEEGSGMDMKCRLDVLSFVETARGNALAFGSWSVSICALQQEFEQIYIKLN